MAAVVVSNRQERSSLVEETDRTEVDPDTNGPGQGEAATADSAPVPRPKLAYTQGR